MNNIRFVRFMQGGWWVRQRGTWFAVNEKTYRQWTKGGRQYFVTDHEDWTSPKHCSMREAGVVLFFCGVLMLCMYYAAGFPL